MDLNVFMVSAEAVPFAKVGGLADVAGALPRELERLGLSVSVLLPGYKTIDLKKFGFEIYPLPNELGVRIHEKTMPFEVHSALLPGTSVRIFLIGNQIYFGRDGIYLDPLTGKDYPDQAERWIFFQQAVLEFLKASSFTPDIIHCHDHQTALVPAYLHRFYGHDEKFRHSATVYTIHNMGYQGLYPKEAMNTAGFGDDDFYPAGPFEFYGMMNFMKAGLVYAGVITTVSDTYAAEIQQSEEYGYKLEGVLRNRKRDLFGILNGIDYAIWNPELDELIPARYSAGDLSGKRLNKKVLLSQFGLDDSKEDWPVLSMISRVDVQKGFDLLVEILDELLDRDLFFVLLGTGDKKTENEVNAIAGRHKGKAGVRLAFDNRLAHLIEAGADMFLMPSKYEPCGLNQMYSLRYGTVPIVRATGGLADTVKEFDPASGTGTGFCFQEYHPGHFKAAIERALRLWADRERWLRLMKNAMEQDFSWTESAKRYCAVYEKAVARKRSELLF